MDRSDMTAEVAVFYDKLAEVAREGGKDAPARAHALITALTDEQVDEALDAMLRGSFDGEGSTEALAAAKLMLAAEPALTETVAADVVRLVTLLGEQGAMTGAEIASAMGEPEEHVLSLIGVANMADAVHMAAHAAPALYEAQEGAAGRVQAAFEGVKAQY